MLCKALATIALATILVTVRCRPARRCQDVVFDQAIRTTASGLGGRGALIVKESYDSKCEGVEAAVGGDEQPVLRRDQRLKMA